ncbi:MAG: Sec-independent protein translocase protein TatB [Alcanivoracaceae bacterium]|jgi:sec-independent protein translocase protein TatB|nr:Sec-independent protein translocase protein TatB [Alcanivoracaceae bacterium]
MFDIGFFELVLIFVICLVVLGPERLPSVARTLGHWTGRARNAFNNLRYELESEAHNRDMQAKFRDKLEELGINEDMLSGGKPPADNQILPGDRTGDENRDDDAK